MPCVKQDVTEIPKDDVLQAGSLLGLDEAGVHELHPRVHGQD